MAATSDGQSRPNADAFAGDEHAPTIDNKALKSFIERIERLEEEKKTIADDIKDTFAEAKGTGFDTKTLRAVLRRRKIDRDQLAEQDALLDLYESTLGVFG